MKFLGHPLHMMLIHFPTALLPMNVVLDAIGFYKDDASFFQAANYCLWGGVLSGLVAMVTGLIDTIRIPKEKKEAVGTAMIHGVVNTTVLLFFALLAYRSWQAYPEIGRPGLNSLIIKSILLLVLFAGNYLGGKLVIGHQLFTNKTEN